MRIAPLRLLRLNTKYLHSCINDVSIDIDAKFTADTFLCVLTAFVLLHIRDVARSGGDQGAALNKGIFNLAFSIDG